MYNKEYEVKRKGECIYILTRKMKHYTKETLKLFSIMAVGTFLIFCTILMKFQPVYAVKIEGTQVGYVQDKEEIKSFVEKTQQGDETKNIAYANVTITPEFEFKFISKQESDHKEEIYEKIEENTEITYFQYAIRMEGEEKKRVNTIEEAEEVIAKVKEELGEETDIGMTKEYNQEKPEETTIEIATVSEEVINQIAQEKKEEEKRKSSTVNGVYLSVTPTTGHITSRFGSRESIRDHAHKGMDIATKTGTPIKAAAQGTVKHSGVMGGYGNLIILDHGNGVQTYYGHCSKLYVKKGEKVSAGDVIAAVGSTGNSTGPHLHFEVRINGSVVNPQRYLY